MDYILTDVVRFFSFLPAAIFGPLSLSEATIFPTCVFILLTCAVDFQEFPIWSSYCHYRTPCLGQTWGILMHHLVNTSWWEKAQ
jgi:hypothetical protein